LHFYLLDSFELVALWCDGDSNVVVVVSVLQETAVLRTKNHMMQKVIYPFKESKINAQKLLSNFSLLWDKNITIAEIFDCTLAKSFLTKSVVNFVWS
jgi:hypothetical protein